MAKQRYSEPKNIRYKGELLTRNGELVKGCLRNHPGDPFVRYYNDKGKRKQDVEGLPYYAKGHTNKDDEIVIYSEEKKTKLSKLDLILGLALILPLFGLWAWLVISGTVGMLLGLLILMFLIKLGF